jgi:hypothetical protein
MRVGLEEVRSRRRLLTAGLQADLEETKARHHRLFKYRRVAFAKLKGQGLVTADGTVVPAQHASAATGLEPAEPAAAAAPEPAGNAVGVSTAETTPGLQPDASSPVPEGPTRPQAKKRPPRRTQAERREEKDRRGKPFADNKADLDSVAAEKMCKEYGDRPGYSLTSCQRTIRRLRNRHTGKHK